jgi:integrase
MPKRTNRLWSVPRITHHKYPGFTIRLSEYAPGGKLHAFRWVDGKQVSRKTGVRRAGLGLTPKAQVRAATQLGCDIIELWATEPETLTVEGNVKTLTLKQLITRYETDGFSLCTERYKQEATAAIRRVAAFLGDNLAVKDLTPSRVAKYMAYRIAQGRAPAGRGDLVALSIAINWAMEESLLDLMQNPLRVAGAKKAMKIQHEQSRPVADAARYSKLRAKADELPEPFGVLLDLAWGTGHRITAIVSLRWTDVSFETTDKFPHGSIRWYVGKRADRKKNEHVLPMNSAVSASLKAWKKECGIVGQSSRWMFEAPEDPRKPLDRWLTNRWLGKAEAAAELDHIKGGGWHAFRRGWATARKHMPLKDVAAGGGWTDTATLDKCYQHADEDSTRRVALHIA